MLKKLIGLAVFVVIVIIVGFVFFNLPQRIGLVKTPTEKLLSVTPDREAATAIMADLQLVDIAANERMLIVAVKRHGGLCNRGA